jgi:hypothetical protein
MTELGEQRRKGWYPIQVVMKDGSQHFFSPLVLDILLEHNRVKKFKRKSGWATVGIDPIRTASRRVSFSSFDGPERRNRH